jgi:ethanolamine utilization protein EutA
MFTTQVGMNPYVSDEAVLPLTNVPVLVPRLELTGEVDPAGVTTAIEAAVKRSDLEDGDQPVALFLEWWDDDVDPARVHAVAHGIAAGLPRTIANAQPLVLIIDQMAAHAVSAVLKDDLHIPGEVVAMEGVNASEFDFIDIAPMIHPSETLPISIKSLLFAGGLDRRSIKQALREALLAKK